MNRLMLILVVLGSSLCLGGCMVISAEEHSGPRHAHVVSPPPVERVEVVRVPGPGPGPGPRPHHPGHPHGWR